MPFFRLHPAPAMVPLLLGLPLAGCNEIPAAVQSDPLIGAWASNVPGGTLYLFITPVTLTYYAEADEEECADRYAYDIEPLGGNRYLLSSTVNATTIESTIIALDGELTWDVGSGTAVFQQASNVDPSMLSVCAGGGDDPTLECSTLPALEPGQDVAGELGQGDPEERGRYYDVYGFQPAAQDTAEITLASDDFDPFLHVYRSDGTFVAENDDASAGSVDAGITLPVVPVCYRVEVTSFGNAETGAYTLRVD
jgi:hypothetical protein